MGCRSASFDPAETTTGVPGFDDKVVSRCSDSRDHDFVDVDKESVRAGRIITFFDFERSSSDLGVAEPESWVFVGIGGGAV